MSTATARHSKRRLPNIPCAARNNRKSTIMSLPPSSPDECCAMAGDLTKPRVGRKLRTERPKLHKVILLNDDFTPREFVVTVLKAEFHVGEDLAQKIMITAHRRGACVVAVFPRDVAETKATRATDAGRAKGYPLMFTTEPEE